MSGWLPKSIIPYIIIYFMKTNYLKLDITNLDFGGEGVLKIIVHQNFGKQYFWDGNKKNKKRKYFPDKNIKHIFENKSDKKSWSGKKEKIILKKSWHFIFRFWLLKILRFLRFWKHIFRFRIWKKNNLILRFWQKIRFSNFEILKNFRFYWIFKTMVCHQYSLNFNK